MKDNREKIESIIKDILGVSDLDSSDYDDIGWDSLKHLDIVLALEEEFSVIIPIEKIESLFHSIENIINLIEESK